MLLSLPAELLETIVRLVSRDDQRRLCLVAKPLQKLALRFLYEDVEFRCEALRPHEINVAACLRAHKREGCLNYTKALHFTGVPSCVGYIDDPGATCLHVPPAPNAEDEFPEHTALLRFDALEGKVLEVLRSCKNDHLRGISWDLLVCCPPSIFGPAGYLAQRQTLLESISLVTDQRCFGWPLPAQEGGSSEAVHGIDLTCFPRLKKLSWVAPRSLGQLHNIRDALDRIGTKLEKLELDFAAWTIISGQEPQWETDDPPAWEDGAVTLGRDVLGITSLPLQPVFTALRSLSLTSVPLAHPKRVAAAINWEILEALVLRCCPCWQLFLHHATESGKPKRLARLELQCLPESDDRDLPSGGPRTMARFLTSFGGLVDLCVGIHMFWRTKGFEVWRAAAHHKATLRTFVYNVIDLQRGVFFPPDHMTRAPEEVFEDISMRLMLNSLANPLAGVGIECFGLYCSAFHLRQIVHPCGPTLRLVKCLHIRGRLAQSLFQIYSNKRWACRREYGEDGQPELRYQMYATDTTRETDPDRPPPPPVMLVDEYTIIGHFANKVFGKEGFPSLQVVALGQFRNSRHYPGNTLILIRRDGPPVGDLFEPVFDWEPRYREIVRPYWDFLMAAPVGRDPY